jgi:general secretion pathway protein A
VSVNYLKLTTSPSPDTLTYEPFFGLTEKPFSLNADPRFVYDSPTYLATKEGLQNGIRRREGLLVLTGEIGSGKTTLCRAVLRGLGRNTYSSLVPDPFASREDLLKMLLIDFGALSIHDLTTGSLRQASRTELGYLLSEFLDSLAADAFVVVIIDEAQNLSLPLIEEMRILSDTFGAKGRLQIVFAGQPELHAKLKTAGDAAGRSADLRLPSPGADEPRSGRGLHSASVARGGGSPDRVLFPPAIVDGLHRRSGGVPRLINRVCDRALHLAYDRKAEAVDKEILDTALIEIGATTLSPTWDSNHLRGTAHVFAVGRACSDAGGRAQDRSNAGGGIGAGSGGSRHRDGSANQR